MSQGPVTTPPGGWGLEVRVLGPLEVVADGIPLVVDTRKALAILVLIAVEGRPFARDELAAMLWPESDDASARGALRRTLSVLRSALGERWLRVDRASVALDGPGVWLDLRAIESALERSEVAGLADAAALARGPFLAGFSLRDSSEFDEWRVTRAGVVERTVSALLERLADAAEAAGDRASAIEAASRRVELDPLDERAQQRLMAILARSGDRAGAMRRYRACVAVLDRDLGVPPLSETTALYEQIRDGRLELPRAGAHPGAGHPAAAGPLLPDLRSFRLPLAGRDAELARARAIVASVGGAIPDGPPGGRLLAVTGEAGIGKSRLVEAVVAQASDAGSAVVMARAYPSETGIAFGTIATLLRSGMARPDGTDRLRSLPEPALEDLSRIVDLPAALGGRSRRRAAERGTVPTGNSRLMGSIAASLAALVVPTVEGRMPGTAARAPGLIVVEDVHWADDASRAALGWLARRLDAWPLVLVLTWRPEDLEGLGAAFVASLEPIPGAELALARLDRDAVERLVAAAGAAGLPVPAPGALLEASEGLPLFVAEALMGAGPIGRNGAGTGALASDMPGRSVRVLLRERLASVGEAAMQVLAAGAVLGRSFDLASVRGVSGRSEDETVATLEELVRRGLLREVEGPGRAAGWDFTHARLRDAVSEATSLGRRQILHRRAADLLRADPLIHSEPARLVALAGHELAAGRGAQAAEAYAQAGLGAARLHANREAAAHLEAAVALGHPDGARLQVALGEVLTALGDYRGAIGALEAAAVLPGIERPGIELRLGRAYARRGDLASAALHLDAALAALDNPGAAFEAEASATLARALVERAAVARRARDPGAGVAAATRALAIAERAADPAAAAAAHRVIGLAARDRGDLAAASAALERSLTLAAEDPDDGSSIAARNALALVLASGGDLDGAIALLEAALSACRRTGQRHLEAAVENNLADVLHAAGRREEAMAHLKGAVATFAGLGDGHAHLEPEVWMLVSW